MLRLIVLIIILILILSFFGVSLESLFNAPATQANFGFAWQLVLDGWNLILQFLTGLLSAVGIHAT